METFDPAPEPVNGSSSFRLGRLVRTGEFLRSHCTRLQSPRAGGAGVLVGGEGEVSALGIVEWGACRAGVSKPSFCATGSRELAAPRGPNASSPALRAPGHHSLYDLTPPRVGPAPGAADPGALSSRQGLVCLETDPGPFLSHVPPPNAGDGHVRAVQPPRQAAPSFPHWTGQDCCTDLGGGLSSAPGARRRLGKPKRPCPLFFPAPKNR